ncbi:hypothetical protein CLV84_3862 [Neolewinella xylanilytica]|uniref:Uncharacterized protein n=1 Tax=Neolewinella xylanilytica TaxID=1514080 RepID=A0A2S6I161_9BACT|nr:hypothetical protein [Neolewinella xylanilytica]PPK84700.1 hypothetical protein CLV84_3862 [Neolewinella xylanilytica]
MALQNLTLTRIESIANVDRECFFVFKSSEGDYYFTFKPDSTSREPVTSEPPVPYDAFRRFNCRVHDLVIPPFTRRVPSLLHSDPGDVGPYGEEVVVSNGLPQRLKVITHFTVIEPENYRDIEHPKEVGSVDFSFEHFHLIGKTADGSNSADSGVAVAAHRPEQSCPRAVHPFGQPNEVITFSFSRDRFLLAYEKEVTTQWMDYIRPESPMYFILLRLSSDDLVYGYYPMNTARINGNELGGIDNFRKDFTDAAGVVYGMPFARNIDLLDIWLIPVVLDEPITKPPR